jgi:hypothetical protein
VISMILVGLAVNFQITEGREVAQPLGSNSHRFP